MNNHSDYDFLFRIIIIGDSGVGKTCLLDKYCNNHFSSNHDATVGIEFGTKTTKFNFKGKNIIIRSQFWDTAGQEAFRSITKSYYRNVAGVILCYDTTQRFSFDHLNHWINVIKKECPQDSKIMLVGTKIDMKDQKSVSTEEGEIFARDNNMLFFEVSSKKDILVNEMFEIFLTEIYKGYINGIITSGIKNLGDMQMNFNLATDCKCYI